MNVKTVAIGVIVGLLAIEFVIAGVAKFPAGTGWAAMFARWGYPPAFRFLVGAVEVGAGAALLMPGARRLASAVLLVVMAGAIYTHVLHGESRRALLPVVLSAPLVWFSARRGDSFHGRVRST